jgi:hypothetical protein
VIPGACFHCPRLRNASLANYPPLFPTHHNDVCLVKLEMISREGYQLYKAYTSRFSKCSQFKAITFFYSVKPVDIINQTIYCINS